MKCPRCKQSAPDNSEFCNRCGRAINRVQNTKALFIVKSAVAYGLGKLTLDALNSTSPLQALSKNPNTKKYRQRQDALKKSGKKKGAK